MSRIVASDEAGLRAAVTELRAGRPVAIPTETVYGLAADAHDRDAVRRIFALKGRPTHHPVIVHVARASELGDWLDATSVEAERLAHAWWPGPLTIVGRAASHVLDAITGGHPTVAVRCPSHPVAAELLERYGGALAAPSANRFGRLSPTRAEHVAEEFASDELIILDGGAAEVGLESTIVDLSGPVARILRPGRIGRDAIAATLGRTVEVAEADDADAPQAPGRLASHYAPHAPLRMTAPATLPGALEPGDAALLCTAADPPNGTVWQRLPDDPDGYARGLYAALRTLDAARPRAIVVETPPADEAWRAVHDRLARAAAPRPEGNPP